MPRNPSKILSVAEAKESELHSKLVEQEKVVSKAQKALEKEIKILDKLQARLDKAEAKRKPVDYDRASNT